MCYRLGIIIISLFCSNLLGFANKHDAFQTGNESSILKDSIDIYLVKSESLVDSLPSVSVKNAERALEISQNFNLQENVAYASKILGQAKLNLREYYQARKYLSSSAIYYEKNSSKEVMLAKISYLQGLTEYYLTNYTDAINFYLKASKIFQKHGLKTEYSSVLQSLGLVYHSLKETDKAEAYYIQSLNIGLELKNAENIANTYQNLGILYYSKKSDSTAIEYYNKSTEYYKQQHNLKGIGINFSNIGLIYLDEKQAALAYSQFEKSLTYFVKIGFKLGQMWAYNNMGASLVMQGKMGDAESNFIKSLEIAKGINSAEGILTNYSDLSKFYEKGRQINLALQYQKEYSQLKNSVDEQKSATRIKELENIYQVENSERQRSELIAQNKNQNTKTWAITGLISILLLAALILLTAYKQKRSAEKKLAEHKSDLEKLVEKRTIELQKQISERKIAEESDKLKSAFLANMSHELRTPMNAIIAFSNFLREPDLSDERRYEYLDHITTAGDSLLRLIDDIIDIAKIESKQLKIFIQPTNINRLMIELYKFYSELRVKNNKKDIRFILNTDNEFNYIINTDSQRLKQVLSNLIENAFKYTDKGKIEIGFETTENSVTFSVTDTGIGIPADKHELIFDRFYQLNNMNDRKISGTGLGLAICKNLIMLLGGQIWVDSESNRGSTFSIRIPVESIKRQPNPMYVEESKNKTQAKKIGYNWNNITILVAEDEDLNYKVLDTCLTRTMAHIIRAKDGASAVEICKNQKVDLVLMDIQMPGMNGFEATQEIKRINNRTPVIAQTSFAMIGEKERCLQAGCDDFITKPLNIDSLLRKIEHYLK
jgi:signal transduction histidine kinase/CheY-like chemotaxis protein